jgi:hypothetical protein
MTGLRRPARQAACRERGVRRHLSPSQVVRVALLVAWLLGPTQVPRAHGHPPSYAPLVSRGQGPADVVLIYQGGVHRLAWTEKQLSGYVTYRDPATGRERWLFDGFLFLEFTDGRGTRLVGQYKLRSATRSDWTWLSDRLFAPGVAIDALDGATASAASRLGRPARRRKVYLGLPEPILHQKDWGELDGGALDFDVPEHRLAAIRWYVAETLRRWRVRAPGHLDLQGFYWVAEDASESRHILPLVADLVHREGLELIWIPYWRSPRLIIWRSLGFDRAYLQPNYFFNKSIAEDRLDEACTTARTLGMGLEVEFDARAWTDPAYRTRLPAYFARFAAGGALAAAPLAWYEAGGAIERMAASADPAVRSLYHDLATVVITRQAAADALVRGRKAARRR